MDHRKTDSSQSRKPEERWSPARGSTMGQNRITDLSKVRNLVKKNVLCNILIEFGKPMKLLDQSKSYTV